MSPEAHLWPCVVGVAIHCAAVGPGSGVPGYRRARRRAVSDGLAPCRTDRGGARGAAVWPRDRFTRVVVALCLIVLVIVGYFVLPSVFDVDTLFRD